MALLLFFVSVVCYLFCHGHSEKCKALNGKVT